LKKETRKPGRGAGGAGVEASLEQKERTGRVIGAAIEVHRALGPGFLETVYESALAIELAHRSIPFVRQVTVPIRYRNAEVGAHVLDLLVEDQIVVELKAARNLEDIHFVILRSYLKATGKEHGLLLNFAKSTLEIKRVSTRTGVELCRVPGFLASFF
jgi:GxxExxY protein